MKILHEIVNVIVKCAWCGRVLSYQNLGGRRTVYSHGICHKCKYIHFNNSKLREV